MGKLTAMGVKNLTEPGRYSDGEGLILKLAAKGKGSWIVRVQTNGKRRDIGLGPLSELPLATAREAARALRKEVKAGVDVLAERTKEALAIPTFSDAAKLVHEEHKAAWKNGKHQAHGSRLSKPMPSRLRATNSFRTLRALQSATRSLRSG